jgi:hypothetical protein
MLNVLSQNKLHMCASNGFLVSATKLPAEERLGETGNHIVRVASFGTAMTPTFCANSLISSKGERGNTWTHTHTQTYVCVCVIDLFSLRQETEAKNRLRNRYKKSIHLIAPTSGVSEEAINTSRERSLH